jgi:hypothetical protein
MTCTPLALVGDRPGPWAVTGAHHLGRRAHASSRYGLGLRPSRSTGGRSRQWICQSRVELGGAHRVPEVFGQSSRKARDHDFREKGSLLRRTGCGGCR